MWPIVVDISSEMNMADAREKDRENERVNPQETSHSEDR